jgi:hypothetical protein
MKLHEDTKRLMITALILATPVILIICILYWEYYKTFILPVKILEEGIKKSGCSYVKGMKK